MLPAVGFFIVAPKKTIATPSSELSSLSNEEFEQVISDLA